MPKAKEGVTFKRKNRLVAAAAAVEGVLDTPALARQLQGSGLLREVQKRWRQVCPLLGAQSWPLGLAGGTLRVAAASSSVAQELKYQAPTIIDAANLLAGYTLVSKVLTVVQPLTAQPAPPPAGRDSAPAPSAQAIAAAGAVCEAVADDDLRDALTRLGARIYQEKK